MARILVAQLAGLLEAQCLRGRVHAGVERAHDLAVLPFEQLERLGDVAGVLVAIDLEAARRGTALDLILDARPRAVAQHGVAATAQRKDLAQHPQRLAHRPRRRERAEIARAVAHQLARDDEPRPAGRVFHLDADIALVVLEADVVARLVLLDQVVLEDERFLLVRGDERLEGRHPVDQEADLRALVAAAEIAADATAQALGLADVDDLVGAVA